MNRSVSVIDKPGWSRAMGRAAACGLLLLILPACGIPALRKPEPAPNLPPDFAGRATEDNSALISFEEFYNDPNLKGLIREALIGNRELKSLNEEVQIASNEVLARSGQYLPFVSLGAGAGLNRTSRFTLEGAGIVNEPYLPGRFFPNPRGDYGTGVNFTWQLDIYRQLRNARDAAGQRYAAANERRNYFVTRMVADIAENYYRLMSLDKRIENLNFTIEIQERGLEIAKLNKEATRGTELGVLRFEAEVRRNQSEKLIVNQDIIETENRINFLVNRFPVPVDRVSNDFFELYINTVNIGVPSQLLRNRPDIRQAERELEASGLDVKVARANFFPQLVLNAGVGLQAFDLRYLFEPQAVIGNLAAGLVGPLVNRRAIRAEYMSANARQLQQIYNYQRVLLNAFTEVVNRVTMLENYTSSLGIKMQQIDALSRSVDVATNLFQNARAEYIDVLLAQRDLRDARMVVIDTKLQQLTAIIDAYQALGGGDLLAVSSRVGLYGENTFLHTVVAGESFASISERYYNSARYQRALWSANRKVVASPDRIAVGDKVIIPRFDQLDPTLFDEGPALAPAGPSPADVPAPAGRTPADIPPVPAPTPPPASQPSPFDPGGPPTPPGPAGPSPADVPTPPAQG